MSPWASTLTAVKLPVSSEPPCSGKTDPGPMVLEHLETQGVCDKETWGQAAFVQGLRTTPAQRPDDAGRGQEAGNEACNRNTTSNKSRAEGCEDKWESEPEAWRPRASQWLGPSGLDENNFVWV